MHFNPFAPKNRDNLEHSPFSPRSKKGILLLRMIVGWSFLSYIALYIVISALNGQAQNSAISHPRIRMSAGI